MQRLQAFNCELMPTGEQQRQMRRFCRGVLTVEDAVVRGRLLETPSGIPVLQVPEDDILSR